ncbi:MAG: endonuclease [Aequorivita sp.]|nr:endonuclease [Aequorivita sp.]|tara:strand:+ start:10234 stop:11049 length:816 start_codon:yes stop_codon:yes gene_type:complete
MNRKFIYPLVIIIVTVALYFAEDFIENPYSEVDATTINTQSSSEEFGPNFLPASTTGAVIYHENYTLSYSEEHEQAEWVAYELKQSDLVKNNFDRPYFVEDKKVKSKSADWRNYKNSGYDRGHLVPAGDRRRSFDAYKETFLTSNISPQDRSFNAGIWNRLEQKTRYWAQKYDGVYVVTGGILKEGLKSIGKERVSVPEEFYKIIVDVTNGNYKAIAFVISNKPSNKSLYKFAVSIDEVENKTGIDFFPKLDDSIENDLEQKIDISAWRLQ